MRIQNFDFTVDLFEALLWQKNKAVNLQALIQQLQDYININYELFWNNFYNDIFNLKTANDFGLAVWAIILQVPLNTQADIPTPTWPIFGFGNASQTKRKKNFTNGNFSPLNDSNKILLSLEERRLVLQIRYYQLISRGSVTEVNQFLKNINAKITMLDGLDMTISYVIDGSYSSDFVKTLELYDILPRPAGVKRKIYVKGRSLFGFGTPAQGTNRKKNFNNGNFPWQ